MKNILYHYTRFRDNGDDFFSTKMLRFSPASELNDPFEFRPAYDGFWPEEKIETFLEAYKEILSGRFDRERRFQVGWTAIEFGLEQNKLFYGVYSLDELREHIMKESSTLVGKHKEYINEEFCLEDIGVLCFSEDPKHIAMWSHYADAHRGFVLGFKKNSEFFPSEDECKSLILRDKKPFKLLGKVDYPPDNIRYSSYISGSDWISNEDERLRRLLFTKSLVWKYEREWRYLRSINRNFRDKLPSGRLVIGLHPVPSQSISKIYLGVNATDELQRAALAFCRENQINELYKGYVHQTKYKIEFLPIL